MRSEIIRSAQVWVCDACGCQDAKSCGCNSTAHQEELAAKKEATRQANRRSREKAKENQTARYNIADVENIEEFEDAESELDEDPENYRSAFLLRADSALKFAVYSGPILTNEMISA